MKHGLGGNVVVYKLTDDGPKLAREDTHRRFLGGYVDFSLRRSATVSMV
jgi:hypothetical protein